MQKGMKRFIKLILSLYSFCLYAMDHPTPDKKIKPVDSLKNICLLSYRQRWHNKETQNNDITSLQAYNFPTDISYKLGSILLQLNPLTNQILQKRLYSQIKIQPEIHYNDRSSEITVLAFRPDGTELVFNAPGKGIFWDLKTSKKTELNFGLKNIQALAYSPDGKQLAMSVGNIDGYTITIYNPKKPFTKLKKLYIEKNYKPGFHTHSLVYSPDGKQLANAYFNGVVIFDPNGKNKPTTNPFRAVQAVAYNSDSTQLAIGCSKTYHGDDGIIIWDPKLNKEISTFHDLGSSSLTYDNNGKQLASSNFRTITILDPNHEKKICTFNAASNITSLAYSPDGKQLACGKKDSNENITILDLRSKMKIRSFNNYPVNSLAYSPDGTKLASGSYGTVQIWDVRKLNKAMKSFGNNISLKDVSGMINVLKTLEDMLKEIG